MIYRLSYYNEIVAATGFGFDDIPNASASSRSDSTPYHTRKVAVSHGLISES